MNESAPKRPNDPRLEAALEDYFNRLDRKESVDRDSFLAEHRQIAAELRQFIATEDEIRKLAAESRGDISQESTGSFSEHPNETLPPRPSDAAGGTKPGELSGNFGRSDPAFAGARRDGDSLSRRGHAAPPADRL